MSTLRAVEEVFVFVGRDLLAGAVGVGVGGFGGFAEAAGQHGVPEADAGGGGRGEEDVAVRKEGISVAVAGARRL